MKQKKVVIFRAACGVYLGLVLDKPPAVRTMPLL